MAMIDPPKSSRIVATNLPSHKCPEECHYGKALAEAARENLAVQRRELENPVAAFNDEGERHVCRFCQQPVRDGRCHCV